MITATDTFYASKAEPNKGCLLALRSIILAQDAKLTETLKYGMSCFCYKKKICCYLWTDKMTDEPYILFAEGQHLHHPCLETGTRKRMKILRINPNNDIPIDIVELLINQALDLYRLGLIKSK